MSVSLAWTEHTALTARETPTGDLQWYYRDNVGSVGALADETGAVLDRYRYSIYGQVELIDVDQQGVEDNPFLFQGRRLDATGLYYYRARQYNPDVGRFYQLDPGNDAMAFGNGYAFVGSNPGTYWDPSGDSGWGLWNAVCDFVSDAVDMVGEALSAAGEMIGEFAAGVVEGVVGSIKGIVNAALHPIDTLNGLIELAKTIAGDPKAFMDRLTKELSQLTPAEQATALGRLNGEVLMGMATAGSVRQT